MPAYRSNAEAEIRGAVVAYLRRIRPRARIIHEINASSFGNRIDVLAVDVENIIAVEIKSEKDKLDRLKAQVEAMEGVSHAAVVALHDRFLTQVRGSAFPPSEAGNAAVWVYPRQDRPGHVMCGKDWRLGYSFTRERSCLPPTAINLLWRSELHAICRQLGLPGIARMDMATAIDEIRWRMTGAEITRAICAALRQRQGCAEADAPIAEAVA